MAEIGNPWITVTISIRVQVGHTDPREAAIDRQLSMRRYDLLQLMTWDAILANVLKDGLCRTLDLACRPADEGKK